MQNLPTNKKILVLVPDGTGVRNFIYSDFLSICLKDNLDIGYWGRNDIISLIKNSVNKISLPKDKHTTTLVEILRKCWQIGLLKHYARVFDDPTYLTYIFKNISRHKIKLQVKHIVEEFIIRRYSGEANLQKLKLKYQQIIRNTAYYQRCKEELLNQNPDILFCTHQRSSEALAPMLAAADLGIKTACFIYSWDNIPKATLYVDAQYYLVWSDYMKTEMLNHHPEISPDRIKVTGTPQFTPYFKNENIIDRREFSVLYNLPEDHQWICYSGDDQTTSPHDPLYLDDLCKAVTEWNYTNTNKLHVLFRRCPTEISPRYDEVLIKHNECVTAVKPEWKSIGNKGNWNNLVPQAADNKILVSLAQHCCMVVNIASTMALDFGIKGKPCIYMNYEQPLKTKWKTSTVYNFIHFRSMCNTQPVIWLKSADKWHEAIQTALEKAEPIINDNRNWMYTICKEPVQDSNNRILNTLLSI